MKVKRILLSVILAVIAIFLVFNTEAFAASGSWKLGAEKLREGITTKNNAEEHTTPYSYQINRKPVLKIVDKANTKPDFNNAIYCLKAGQGFGSDSNVLADVNYDTYYDMVSERDNVNNVINLSESNYNSVLWLLDNIYLPKQLPIEDRQQARNDLLNKAFKKEFEDVNSETFYGWTVDKLYITDDDIEVVQQWALWHFTNAEDENSTTFSTNDLPPIFVSETGNGEHNVLSEQGNMTEDWKDPVHEGYIRQEEAEVLYKYFITEAEKNNNYDKEPTKIALNKELVQTITQTTLLNKNYMIVGPFEIQKTGNTFYTFTGTVVDKSGKNLSYNISDKSGNPIADIRTLEEAVGKGEFYLKIEKPTLTDDELEGVKLHISYTTNDTTATFWTVNNSKKDQPVVVVERSPKTLTDEISVEKPEFDLALRKYITKVTRNGVNLDIDELTGRIPNINKNILSSESTAEYKHRKDPVPVQTGDIVTYRITIYNEGELSGRATKIIDYLPAGLVFEGSNSANYDFSVSSDGRTITITPKTSYIHNLSAYNGATLDSETIEFTCKVTKKEEKGTGVDTILTNVAEITEAYDLNNVKMYLEGDDRDSEPNGLRRPSDTELPSYKGESSNKSDLSDSTNHYKGQQDDDDFEKLKVTTPEFDLALRKFITHIDGKEVTPSREPVVDTTALKNKTGETAKYTHSKVPLTVGIGSTIRYTIRIYNEGELDGYVTVIEDYLPEELELIPASKSTINEKYGWTEVNGRVITSSYLNNVTIDGYDGGDTLSYKEVEVECKVKDIAEDGKILTNIAQINGDSADDRDSNPQNVTKPTDENLPNYNQHQEDDDDFEKVVIYKPGYDLALRKFITHVDGKEVTPSREPVVDTTDLANKTATTAKYTHPKNPITVKIGSIIRYTIRVYNEGQIDGYATIVEDYLPEELELVPVSESTINNQYGWTATDNGRIVTTEYLKDRKIDAYTGGDELDYEDIQIECRLKETENLGKILTNIAQINGDDGEDRDSQPSNVVKPNDENLPNYNQNQQDDDDYEKVKVFQPEYDLALRKFITEVDGEEPNPSREPVVDVTPLKDDSEDTTTAKYTHPKTPLLVENGDIVVYTIRVYNEGKVDGYAEEIKDDIPDGLEFVIDNPINIEYRWKLSDDAKHVTTDYLSSDRDENNVIKAFDSATMTTLDYKDVKIAFKVIEPNTSTRVLVNVAEIKDDNGKDIDSTPDNNKEDEDDLDKEYVKVRYFDLALRKFITKVESKSGDNLPVQTDTTTDVSREPKVEIDENGNIKYVHPKDPVIVANSDIVIYTLRVYNEGTIDGYAEEIKDDVPEGLELVPEHEVNVKYGWVMYDEDGNITDNPSEAKTIRTTYLSEANNKDNIINAFDRETMEAPAYKDVQVAFRVVDKNIGEDRVVINTAEISKDNDDDVDSTPDNDDEDEDDLDKEYVKVQTFDLSLLKWVSKVMITQNGKTTVTETGYNGTENPEPVVKVEVKEGQIKTILIKYEYGIKITNEGEIAGYATEITDYIPEGLEFIPEDNPLWTLEEDGKIVTRQLENTLLQPGESAVVNVVFKWINNENNMGMKENIAEISEDKNDKDAPDKDSTPDNQIPEEDDQDNAFVLLMPKTGEVVVFIVLPTIILAVLTTGIVLIKKYVL